MEDSDFEETFFKDMISGLMMNLINKTNFMIIKFIISMFLNIIIK
jgi:hypothetical protein